MNWLQKISQSFAEPEITNKEQSIDYWNAYYPRTGGQVGGLLVLDDVPNTESIGASFDDYEILPGIREIHDFGVSAPLDIFYFTGVKKTPWSSAKGMN